MSAPIDCPICMDCIETTTKNCVTTECGHCFHTSCLMQSVSHTGFGCPYCRTSMAEEQSDENSVYSWADEDPYSIYDDDALRGFRLFFNIINGEEPSQEDSDAEDHYVLDNLEVETPDVSDEVPPVQYVADRLREQGITFEKIVEMFCHLDHEGYRDMDGAERFSNEMYGKIRRIISRYQPNMQQEEVVEVVEEVKETRIKIETNAQPKSFGFEQKRKAECC